MFIMEIINHYYCGMVLMIGYMSKSLQVITLQNHMILVES
jgi:hypothetical protein